MKPSWTLLVLLGIVAASSFAAEPNWTIIVQPAEVHQGGIAQLRVSAGGIAGIKALHGQDEITLFPGEDGSYRAFLGFDLEQRPGPLKIRLRGRSADGKDWTKETTVYVKAKEFPRETISVPPAFDQLDRATLKRIEKERAELDRLWKIHSPRRLWDGRFVAPVPGTINSPFGFRRVINGLARAPHTGVDLKAALGSEVVAANHGRVVFQDDLFFSGNSLVLDHGGGLYTTYFHLSEFRAQKDSEVRKGDVIGLAGMTGRVTGPHLHWAARLNGARIDPMELLAIQEGERREATGERQEKESKMH
jgi:murein DD-endopeptidase MepM/ murein hydrolase activator NlpD